MAAESEDALYARVQVQELIGGGDDTETAAIVSAGRLEDAEALRKGRSYAQMACATPGWRTSSSSKFHSYSFASEHSQVFSYSAYLKDVQVQMSAPLSISHRLPL